LAVYYALIINANMPLPLLLDCCLSPPMAQDKKTKLSDLLLIIIIGDSFRDMNMSNTRDFNKSEVIGLVISRRNVLSLISFLTICGTVGQPVVALKR
jgi:hypothetical protein